MMPWTLSVQGNLLYWMTRCDYKLRDQGTLLGFFWTLLHPFLMFLVLYLVFAAWFESHVDNYPLFLILGLIHWNFFSLATSNAVTIFDRKRDLLKNFPFNGIFIPIMSVLSVFLSYVVETVLVLTICSFFMPLTLKGIVWFLMMVLANLGFALGVALVLSSLYVFFRDVEHLWGIALRIGFFLTPVFYPIDIVESNKLVLLKLNPLYHVFTYSREALLYGTIQFDGYLWYITALLAAMLIASFVVFKRSQNMLVEQL